MGDDTFDLANADDLKALTNEPDIRPRLDKAKLDLFATIDDNGDYEDNIDNLLNFLDTFVGSADDPDMDILLALAYDMFQMVFVNNEDYNAVAAAIVNRILPEPDEDDDYEEEEEEEAPPPRRGGRTPARAPAPAPAATTTSSPTVRSQSTLPPLAPAATTTTTTTTTKKTPARRQNQLTTAAKGKARTSTTPLLAPASGQLPLETDLATLKSIVSAPIDAAMSQATYQKRLPAVATVTSTSRVASPSQRVILPPPYQLPAASVALDTTPQRRQRLGLGDLVVELPNDSTRLPTRSMVLPTATPTASTADAVNTAQRALTAADIDPVRLRNSLAKVGKSNRDSAYKLDELKAFAASLKITGNKNKATLVSAIAAMLQLDGF